nr:hypothetical protein [Thermoleophilaceae bacterium]
LADGEADADALALLRPHLKTCLSCRARLREFRAAPAHVAALVPVVLVAVDGGGARGLVESAVGTLHQKAESVVGAPQQKVEGIPAVAGGGTAVDQLANHHGPPQRAAVQQAESPSDESAAGPDPSPSLPPAAVE